MIGESANPEVVECIRRIAASAPQIQHVNEVLTMHMGPDFILVNLSVEFVDSASADDIEKVIAGVDRQLKQMLPRVKRVFVEAEPRIPRKAINIKKIVPQRRKVAKAQRKKRKRKKMKGEPTSPFSRGPSATLVFSFLFVFARSPYGACLAGESPAAGVGHVPA